ncbi:MAG: methyltransferase domain-containing protein [Dehalococcoidia bacterium]|nr:methyltransferase domain-containing protein [Dehalococcoidia bacterium]
MERVIPGCEIDSIYDGLVLYRQSETSRSPLASWPFFNNTYLLLARFDGPKRTSHEYMLRQAIRNKAFFERLHMADCTNCSFRIVASRQNVPSHVSAELRESLEEAIIQNSKLRLDRTMPDLEILILSRSENIGLVGLRKNTERDRRRRGEVRPELAYILCLLACPTSDDVFLDPFCGSGAIPDARSRLGLCRKILATDIRYTEVLKTRTKLKSSSGLAQCDARALPFLDSSITRIVTDPPWGYFESDLQLATLYSDFLEELARVLTPDGMAVVLTAQKELFEANVSVWHDLPLILKSKYETLVSGQKATVYAIGKEEASKDTL